MSVMKKWLSLFIAIFIALCLVGCCGGISEEEYQQVLMERDTLRLELQELQNSVETEKQDTVQVVISGTFAATVRNLIPDYVSDERLNMGVVTLFQCPPFLMYTGEFTDQLEIGKNYIFEIEPKTVEVTAEEYEINFPDPEIVMQKYHLILAGVRESLESERGLDSVHLMYELCD